MAHYDNLPVYKAAYDLLLYLFFIARNLKREYKYTIGEKIKNDMSELIIMIYKANSTREKTSYIAAAREKIETVRLQVRLLKDLKQIDTRRLAIVTPQVESISKQLAAWHKSSLTQTAQEQA